MAHLARSRPGCPDIRRARRSMRLVRPGAGSSVQRLRLRIDPVEIRGRRADHVTRLLHPALEEPSMDTHPISGSCSEHSFSGGMFHEERSAL